MRHSECVAMLGFTAFVYINSIVSMRYGRTSPFVVSWPNTFGFGTQPMIEKVHIKLIESGSRYQFIVIIDSQIEMNSKRSQRVANKRSMGWLTRSARTNVIPFILPINMYCVAASGDSLLCTSFHRRYLAHVRRAHERVRWKEEKKKV